jgi:RNA polymerase sigma factor (sigma-70 family)
MSNDYIMHVKLIKRFYAGEVEALAELYEMIKGPLRKHAYYELRKRTRWSDDLTAAGARAVSEGLKGRARELADETIARVFEAHCRGLAGWKREKGPVLAWMKTVLTHILIDHRRRENKRYRADVINREDRGAGDPERIAVETEERTCEAQLLAVILGCLEPLQREILRLHYLGNMTFSDIGHHLGVSPATMSRWKGKGQEQLDQLKPSVDRLRESLTPQQKQFAELRYLRGFSPLAAGAEIALDARAARRLDRALRRKLAGLARTVAPAQEHRAAPAEFPRKLAALARKLLPPRRGA